MYRMEEEKEQDQEQEGPELMLKPSSFNAIAESNSMVSATLGRVMHTLLDARPKKLQQAISNLHSPPKLAPLSVSLEQSLLFLHKYVGDAAEKEDTLDEVLVPMIEHYLKFRESRHGNQAMVLLNWLFQDEVLFEVLASNLAGIISRKDDHYIALGWCFLARDLVEYEISMNKLMSNGIRENYTALLKILCSCIRPLSTLISSGSTLQGGFELPTRLAIASADFILSLTIALTRKDPVSDYNKEKLINSNSRGRPVFLLNADSNEEKVKADSKASVILKDMGTKLLLWDHIDDLIVLVGRLKTWSRKSRLLHSRGLERVFKWLQATQAQYVCYQNEADTQMLKTGILLLSSCWKHYGMLSHLEDCNFSQQYKELLDEYLSGIKFYADNHSHERAADKDSAIETIKFFFNCLSLLLGRLHEKQLETALAENGSLLSEVLISQFRCADEEVIDSAVYIFKAAIFRTQYTSSGDYNANTREMDSVLPMLIHLLDERDSAAKAAVKLVAEYCFLCSDNCCLQNVLKGLISGNFLQRMNAVDVIADLTDISIESGSSLSRQMWQDIADHLLECLGDEAQVIQTRASALLPVIDPSLTLPALVRLMYTPNERVQSLASETLVAVLKTHKKEPEALCLLLDCLGNLCNTSDPDAIGDAQGAKLDSDRVLKLLPEWSKLVEDWNVIISALLDKLFAEPSNAVIVRSLSYISEDLADFADLVFDQLLLYTKGQNNIQQSVSKRESGTCQDVDSFNSLFSRLCPLLVIKLLPLKVFDNLNSPLVYGEHLKESVVHDAGHLTIDETECIGALLIDRAFNKFEFEDVRKLAAELCGRMHPHVLIPLISSQLEVAAKAEDTMKIKSCLFTICTSLLVRGKDSYEHPGMGIIRNTVNTILSWPSMDRNDVLKAQHGCIDCLAWMMCAELEGSKRGRSSTSDEARIIDMGPPSGDVTLESSVCSYVIGLLTADANDSVCSGLAKWSKESDAKMHISFRLCMANVLISACQKVSESGKMLLAQKILPPVICSTRVITESEIRAACNQVLFSAVYHLKSAVLPYSSDILKIALTSLRDVMEKVRITGAKLLASLMASEEAVIHSISGGLLEARTVLQTISTSDPSMEVRQLCQKLLACLTS